MEDVRRHGPGPTAGSVVVQVRKRWYTCQDRCQQVSGSASAEVISDVVVLTGRFSFDVLWYVPKH